MRHILFCLGGYCLREGREGPALPGCDCFWMTACGTVVLLVDVGFCEGLAVF